MAGFEPDVRSDPTTVTAYRGPEDHDSARVKVDMRDKILLYMPSATPFLTITAGVKGKRTATNKKFEWLEKDFKPRTVTDTAGITSSGVTLTLSDADGDKLAPRDLIKNTRTGDLALVTAEAAGSVTIVRAIGGSGSVGVTGDVWLIIGTSYADNATIGTMKTITEYPNYNYTQIFRRPFGFTGRDLVTSLYGGSDKMNETKWMGVEHKRDIELAMLFGKRHLIAAVSGTSHETSFTGGLEWGINTNRWDVGGVAITKRAFDEFLEEGLRWGRGGYLKGSGTKYLFHAARWGTIMNEWADSKLQYTVLDKQYGMAANKYESPHGNVMLVHAPILDENHADMAFLVDVNEVDMVALKGRDTKLLSGREDNSLDGEAYEYFSDVGLQVNFEQSHALLSGLNV